MADERTAIPRPAARVLLCDSNGRVLLFRARFDGREFWIAPGGGLAANESHEDAALRELWEETGLIGTPDALTWVWTRSHVYEFRGEIIDQQERYYLLAFEETPQIAYDNWEDEEREFMLDHRWWSVVEIEASTEVFAPREIGRLLHELLQNGTPSQPFDVGI